MNSKTLRLALLAGALAGWGLLAVIGCSKRPGGLLLPNQRPSVDLTNAPVAPDRSNPYFYAYRVEWSGYDPDGRVDHYEYAIDPTAKDTVWIKTPRNGEILFFRASQPDPPQPRQLRTASDFHVFVLKAVDNDGAESERKARAFYAYTIAPSVQITNPLPTPLLEASVTPSVRIEWNGQDVDGQFSTKPIKYKFKLLNMGIPGNSAFLSDPDSLRRRDVATNWAGWDSTTADTQFFQFTNLTPSQHYLFALIGFDEAGAYSPVFTLNTNMLQFKAGYSSSNGPFIRFFNEFIDFTYQSAGYSADPLREVVVEVPTKVNITVNWDATPVAGSNIQYFRWMVDGNINDQTLRSDQFDYIHWSTADPTRPNSVTLRPLTDGVHRFYLECGDNNNQKSLGILRLTAVTPSFDKNLLVVDDTRLEVDKFVRDPTQKQPDPYTSDWPARTELDTFMFARGGFVWRGTRNPPPPAVVTSQPGLFAGYDYDTLGTRLGLERPANGVLLSRIGRYKNLVWFLDPLGAQYDFHLDQRIQPVTALWAMSGPGLASTLAAYTQLGGRVWLCGGGAAYASLVQFDKRGNNSGQTTVFSSAAQFGELAPSRLMYDAAHWQSQIAVVKSGIQTIRNDYYVRFKHADGQLDSTQYTVTPGWSHFWHAPEATTDTLRSAQYSKLPPRMRGKGGDPFGVDPDPVPASRSPSYSYSPVYPCEYIRDLNAIIEDVDPDPDVAKEVSVLDTLYMAQGTLILLNRDATQIPAPTMTYYHGNQVRQFVFSGFAPWLFARRDRVVVREGRSTGGARRPQHRGR